MTYLILGCGYTGQRVALRLLTRGAHVWATATSEAGLSRLAALGAHPLFLDVCRPAPLSLPDGPLAVLHSVPVVQNGDRPVDPTPELLRAIGRKPQRLVYLSTTGVYGVVREVNENTPVHATSERLKLRIAAEQAVAASGASWMVLRPAAIYGPWRGVHQAMREGRFTLAEGPPRFTSRIHVEDLAALAEAALLSEVTGAWPVADEFPCSSDEVAEFCATLLGLPPPPRVPLTEQSETRRANRRVDGRAACDLLGVRLTYPTYREGIRAALAEEAG